MDTDNHPPLRTISDINAIAPGMMFGTDFIIYEDFSALRKIVRKVVLGFSGVIYVSSGKAAFTLNDIPLMAEAGQMVFFKTGDYVSDILFSPDNDGKVIAFESPLPFESRTTAGVGRLSTITGNCVVLDADPKLVEIIDHYSAIFKLKYELGIENIRLTMIALVDDVLTFVADHVDSLSDGNYKDSSDRLYRRFASLLIESFPKPREAQWYADALSVSPKHLAKVVSRVSGKRMSEWINEAVIADIRTALIHTDDSVKEISCRLGFNNAAFFGKYVKKHTGMTPGQLKASLRNKVTKIE